MNNSKSVAAAEARGCDKDRRAFNISGPLRCPSQPRTSAAATTALAALLFALPLFALAASALTPLIAASPHGPFAIRQRGDRGTSLPLTIELP